MNFQAFDLLLMLAFIHSLNGQRYDPLIGNESAIINQLLKNYNTFVRPKYDFQVNVGLTVKQIIGLDEKNEVMSTSVNIYV